MDHPNKSTTVRFRIHYSETYIRFVICLRHTPHPVLLSQGGPARGEVKLGAAFFKHLPLVDGGGRQAKRAGWGWKVIVTAQMKTESLKFRFSSIPVSDWIILPSGEIKPDSSAFIAGICGII